MPKLMIDDPTRTNPLALMTTAKMAATSDIVASTPEYLTVSGDVGIVVVANIVITVGNDVFKTEMTPLNVSHLDAGGAFAVGSDYYVYICNNGTVNETYRISLNSTFPAGFNADNSRKIGGFHYGSCRRINAVTLQPVNASNVERGTGWQGNTYNGIVPRSVWTLLHRPKCAPEGMVYISGGTWADIYLSSVNGAGGLRSAISALPATGTEGYHWLRFAELLAGSGKRMLSLAEWLTVALGAPAGENGNNNNAWAATTNSARQLTGFVANAVSSLGCRDTTGNVLEWLDEISTRYDASGSNAIQTSWTWRDVVGGAEYGQVYMNAGSQIVALNAGGAWDHGVHAGPRCLACNGTPWRVHASWGVRGASDSL